MTKTNHHIIAVSRWGLADLDSENIKRIKCGPHEDLHGLLQNMHYHEQLMYILNEENFPKNSLDNRKLELLLNELDCESHTLYKPELIIDVSQFYTNPSPGFSKDRNWFLKSLAAESKFFWNVSIEDKILRLHHIAESALTDDFSDKVFSIVN